MKDPTARRKDWLTEGFAPIARQACYAIGSLGEAWTARHTKPATAAGCGRTGLLGCDSNDISASVANPHRRWYSAQMLRNPVHFVILLTFIAITAMAGILLTSALEPSKGAT